MFEAYRVPRDYMPYWHFGARMGIGTVRRFYSRMRKRGHVRVLDAGTGGGANVLLGARMGFRVTGGDLSRDALTALRRHADRVTPRVHCDCVQTDSCALPFSDGAFDIVVASHIIEHLSNPRLLLEECVRVLRPGGVLRVSCPSRSHGTRVGLWLGLRLDPDDHVVKGYDVAEISGLLPAGTCIGRVSYQGRVIESNVSDAQFLLARAMGMSGNPAAGGAESAPSLGLFVLKELLTLPLLALAKFEDVALYFVKGSMISVEIGKWGE